MANFKPMLAVAYDPNKVPYPVLSSPKLDGIRCLVIDGVPVSRNLKPIPNRYIQEQFAKYKGQLDGFDGELLLKDLTAPFNEVSSAIMSRDGEPEFVYMVFDNFSEPYEEYVQRSLKYLLVAKPVWLGFVESVKIDSHEALAEYESECLEQGYEGVMIRRADGKDKYKFGRSTVNEAYLLKVKQFEDDEAIVVGFEERLHNGNEATKDALGHTERSSHKANMVPMDTLGALVVEHPVYGRFSIGTGFDDMVRKHIWENREEYLGKYAKFKHQKQGAKEGGTVRFPVWLGFRDIGDMS